MATAIPVSPSQITELTLTQAKRLRAGDLGLSMLDEPQLEELLREHHWLTVDDDALMRASACLRKLLQKRVYGDKIANGHILELVAAAAGFQGWYNLKREIEGHRPIGTASSAHASPTAVPAAATIARASVGDPRYEKYAQHRAIDAVSAPVEAARKQLRAIFDDGPELAEYLWRIVHASNPHRFTKGWIFGYDAELMSKWSIASGEMIASRVSYGPGSAEEREAVIAESMCDVLTGQGFCGYIKAAMTNGLGVIEPRSAPPVVLVVDKVSQAIELAERHDTDSIFATQSPRGLEQLLGLSSYFGKQLAPFTLS